MANFVGQSAAVNAAKSEDLPPPLSVGKPEQHTTFEEQGVKMEAKHMEELRKLAREQDKQRRLGSANMDMWRNLLDCA